MTAKTVMARTGRDSSLSMPATSRNKDSSVRVMASKIANAKPLSKSELISAFAGVKRRAK